MGALLLMERRLQKDDNSGAAILVCRYVDVDDDASIKSAAATDALLRAINMMLDDIFMPKYPMRCV